MRKKISKRKNELPITTKNIIGILISCAVGLFTVVVSTLFISLILTKSSVISNSIGGFFIGCNMVSALITGFIASKQCNFKGMISGLITSIPYSLGITIIMLFFSHGQLNLKTIVLYLGIVICSVLGGIISANTKRRR